MGNLPLPGILRDILQVRLNRVLESPTEHKSFCSKPINLNLGRIIGTFGDLPALRQNKANANLRLPSAPEGKGFYRPSDDGNPPPPPSDFDLRTVNLLGELTETSASADQIASSVRPPAEALEADVARIRLLEVPEYIIDEEIAALRFRYHNGLYAPGDSPLLPPEPPQDHHRQ